MATYLRQYVFGRLALGKQGAFPYTHVTRASDRDAGVCHSKVTKIQKDQLIVMYVLIFHKFYQSSQGVSLNPEHGNLF